MWCVEDRAQTIGTLELTIILSISSSLLFSLSSSSHLNIYSFLNLILFFTSLSAYLYLVSFSPAYTVVCIIISYVCVSLSVFVAFQ